MTSRAVKRRLAEEVSLWQADGLLGDEAAGLLRQRYDVRGFGLASIARTLGVTGALFAGFGILGAVGALSGSLALGTVELLAVAGGLLAWGLRMARDPLGRSPQSARAILAIGLFALAAAGALASEAADLGTGGAVLLSGLASLPVAVALAYRFRIGFLLVLALLGLFHWIGSWHSMVGRSTYAFDIQDPRVMALAAAAAAGVGILQRRGRLPGPAGFDAAFLSVGLTYLNLSLLILTVDSGRATGAAAAWIAAAFAAALIQILLGALEKSAVLIGFGVSAFGVNLFPRYFERFWDHLELGLLLLVGGALLFAFGAGCEWLARRIDLSPAGAPRAGSSQGVQP
jgi:hypothetical protein